MLSGLASCRQAEKTIVKACLSIPLQLCIEFFNDQKDRTTKANSPEKG